MQVILVASSLCLFGCRGLTWFLLWTLARFFCRMCITSLALLSYLLKVNIWCFFGWNFPINVASGAVTLLSLLNGTSHPQLSALLLLVDVQTLIYRFSWPHTVWYLLHVVLPLPMTSWYLPLCVCLRILFYFCLHLTLHISASPSLCVTLLFNHHSSLRGCGELRGEFA